ncbi:hypothetical protein MAR_033443, partial [Mya arenaria]
MSDRDLFTQILTVIHQRKGILLPPHSNEVLQSSGSETQPPSPDQGDQPPYSSSETQPPSPDLGDQPPYSGSETQPPSPGAFLELAAPHTIEQLTPLELASQDQRTVSSDVSLDSPSTTEHK